MERLDLAMLQQRGGFDRRSHRPPRLHGVALEHRRDGPRLRRAPAVRYAQQICLELSITDRRAAAPRHAVDQTLDIPDPDGLEDPGRAPGAVLGDGEQEMLAARSQHTALCRHVDRLNQGRVRRRRARHPPQHQLITDPTRAHDRREHVAPGDSMPLTQRTNVPMPGERQEQVLRFNERLTQHPRLILGQQDQVVRLIGERRQHHPIVSRKFREAGGRPRRRSEFPPGGSTPSPLRGASDALPHFQCIPHARPS